jgi:hypothetical protein
MVAAASEGLTDDTTCTPSTMDCDAVTIRVLSSTLNGNPGMSMWPNDSRVSSISIKSSAAAVRNTLDFTRLSAVKNTATPLERQRSTDQHKGGGATHHQTLYDSSTNTWEEMVAVPGKVADALRDGLSGKTFISELISFKTT